MNFVVDILKLDVKKAEHFVISVSQYRSCQCVDTVVS